MGLAWIEGRKRARFALDGFRGALDRYSAGDHLQYRPLANLVIAKLLATLKVDHDHRDVSLHFRSSSA